MASTNKTARLGLNDWLGTDAPMREDFCRDNRLIDAAVGEHAADAAAHLSAADRTLLTEAFVTGTYTGDGAEERAFSLGFQPRFGAVWASDWFLIEYDRNQMYNVCALGFTSPFGDSVGVHTTADGFSVDYFEGAGSGRNSMPVFNREGVKYVYAMWR